MERKKLEYHRKYNRERYHKRRKHFIEQLGGKCVKCGSTERLEFDHINPSDKSFPVSEFWACSMKKVEPEFRKCQLLCRSCHRLKTMRENGQEPARGTHGTLSSYRYCKCSLCREAKSKWQRQYMRKRRAAQKRDKPEAQAA